MPRLSHTKISKDCSRKAMVYIDKNGHYEVRRYFLWESVGWTKNLKDRTYKHLHTADRAVAKWVGKV